MIKLVELSKFIELLSNVPRFEELDHARKKVLLRVDINVPLDKARGEILDDFRIYAHSKTVKKLLEYGCSVVILAHQGRPGDKEFSSLEVHAKYLEKYLGRPVNFVEDVMGPTARETIKKLSPGEVLLLDNVRFVSEEMLEKTPEEHSKSYLVRRLAPLFDEFILDAFAAIHRPHASIVGFTQVMPSCMGVVLQSEVDALKKILESGYRNTLIIAGGSKIPETIKVVTKILEKNIADKILVGGLVSTVFTAAKHGLTGWIKEYVEKNKLQEQVDKVKMLLDKYPDKIVTPLDHVVLMPDGAAKLCDVPNVEGEIVDIGPRTLDLYRELVKQYSTVIMTGPVGWVERDEFAKGTLELLNTMISHCKFTAIGGGHTVMIARKKNLLDKLSHISTGGRAFLYSLAGEELPGLIALVESKKKFFSR